MAKTMNEAEGLQPAVEYRVLEPLEHDGVPFLPGDTIATLTEAQAEALLLMGVIR